MTGNIKTCPCPNSKRNNTLYQYICNISLFDGNQIFATAHISGTGKYEC